MTALYNELPGEITAEWNRPYEEAGESAETVLEGEMPLWQYELLHPAARLSSEERRILARGLDATLGSSPSDGDETPGRSW